MLTKQKKNMFRKLSLFGGRFPGRRGITALYLSGDKAKEQFAVLTPHMDIDKVMKNPEKLLENIFRRDLQIDIRKLYKRYDLYVNTTEGKQELEQQREAIFKKINNPETSDADKEQLKLMAKNLRDAAKSLRDHSYSIEEDFILKFLELPNSIHERVPAREEKVLFSNIPKEKRDTKDHLTLDAERTIEFVNVTSCFFKGEAAKFDYLFPHYCCNYFTKERGGFHQFSNPDFVRTILLEGGSLQDIDRLFQVKEDHSDEDRINLLHLCGGGSMLSFLGFLTKLQIFPNVLPLKLIATGKQYCQVQDETPSLFNLTQSTTVQALAIGRDEVQALQIFDELVNDLRTIFERIPELRFRMVTVPAWQMGNNASLKVAVQMFSNHSQEFVEVGNVIYYGDYISQRLLFSYKDQKQNKFPHLVSATVVDVPKLIGCHVENTGDVFRLPEFLR